MEAIRQGDIPGVQLRRRVEVAGASPAAIWPYWTGAQLLEAWLCDRARVEPGPPIVWRLESGDPPGPVCREYAEFFERIEGLRLVFGLRRLDAGWTSATKVTVELAAGAEGCQVMVFQEGFQQLPLSIGMTAWEESRSRWSRALERLAGLAGAGAS